MITLTTIDGDREPWLDRLLEADESEAIVRAYLHEGELLAIEQDGEAVGVALLLFVGGEVEIKNLAIDAPRRGQGIGAAVIQQIAALARSRGEKFLCVGTADTSDDALRFYRRCGFEQVGVRKGFFDRYPDPVIENGRRARDMILLEMAL